MLKLTKKLLDTYPDSWKKSLEHKDLDVLQFRNLQHFKNEVAKLKQVQDDNCGVTYAEAVKDLLNEKPLHSVEEYESIRNLVRSNLLKRGLITEEVYESYRYAVEGEIVDVSRVIEENPECFLTPAKTYSNWFYELYINISYSGRVENKDVTKNCLKLLATIEELERQHIYIKITLVDVSKSVSTTNKDLFLAIPLFDYRQPKTADTMSSVINDRLLRKFSFAISEEIYKHNLQQHYGIVKKLDNTINIGDTLDEIEIFTDILDKVIVPGER